MKLEITFQGKTRNRDAFIRSIQRLAKSQEYQLGAWKDGMRVVLCPLGYLDMGWTRESGLFGGWKITGGCITVPGGPGLHKAVAELIDALSKKDLKEVQVVDGTGFWEHRDFQRLSQETYGPWLEQELRGALGKLEQSSESVPLFWGEEDYLPQEVPDTVYTPMGRFSKGWLQEQLDQGRKEELARRIFLWPNASKDAFYYRNGAMKRMWQDCCFAPSDRHYSDEQINGFVLSFLERAYQLDPALPLPMSAYRELCIMDGRNFKIPEDAPELEEEFTPGYHKGELLQSYERLWLPLPGVYRYEWSDDGLGNAGCIWIDEDGGGPIWRVSGYRNKDGAADWNADMSELKDVETLEPEGGKARWGWKDIPNKAEPDMPLRQLLGEVAAGDTLYVITVTFSDDEEQEEIYDRLHRMKIMDKQDTPFGGAQ